VGSVLFLRYWELADPACWGYPPGGAAPLAAPPAARFDQSAPPPPPAKLYTRPLLQPPGAPEIAPAPPPAAPKLETLPPQVTRDSVPERLPVTAAQAPSPGDIKATDHFTLAFVADAEALDEPARRLLDGLALRLREEPARRLELRGYAAMPREGTENQARRLALGRALAARNRLMEAGIRKERLLVFAFAVTAGASGGAEAAPPDRVDLTLIR
jgi:outer membrane protein OmpA-like peptidoglycan-associated protein